MSIQAAFFGNLTRDPEQRQVNGKFGTSAVTNFTVAVDARRKDNNGNNSTTYIRVSVWGDNTGKFILNNFHHGSPIFVSGELVMNEYQDKNGQNRQSLECRADNVEFVPRNKDQRPQQQWQQPQQGYQPSNQMPFNNAPQGAPQNGPQNGFYQQQGNQPQQRQNTPQQQNMGQMNNVNAAMPTNGQQPNNNQQPNNGQQAFGPASNGYRQ